ncbi:MAG: FAD-dependent oxidoreductase, partial [Acidobacteria bacterium]|nr:FAD-dependent oxidoreductase [Acidobacteriota bacterium]
MAEPRIVVIGGGFAGLSAAVMLAHHGRAVTVLDARPRLGGRATAFRDRDTGELVDNGQHVMFGCYRETLAFLQRIGAGKNVCVQPALEVPFVDAGRRRSVLRCPTLPAPLHLLAGVLAWDALPWRDRLSALRLAPALLRGRLGRGGGIGPASRSRAMDTETVLTWLRRNGQSPGLIDRLWEPLAVAALNQPINEAAAAPFVRVLADMFGADRANSALVLPTRPLDEMYATPSRVFLEARGAMVRTDALARVLIEDGHVTGVEVRGERIPADVVVSTVPWHQLRALFAPVPPALAQIVANASVMRSMPIVTVNLWYDRVVMDDAFVGLAGRSMQWVFDKRRVFGETASHLSLVSSAAVALAPLRQEELIALATREAADSLVGTRDATLLRATVVREKQATFSLRHGEPPRPATRTPVASFFLAGDWTDTGLPGTIESAVVSGHSAARAIL